MPRRGYVVGDRLTVIDIGLMRVAPTLTAEKNLLEVAVGPDDHTLVLRNLHNIELFHAMNEDLPQKEAPMFRQLGARR